jgi:hypothetical protein
VGSDGPTSAHKPAKNLTKHREYTLGDPFRSNPATSVS